MTTTSIQDRTPEFKAILSQVQKRNVSSKGPGQRTSLLTAAQKREANGETKESKSGRSEFARNAAQIGRSITSTMTKLEKLAQLAKRKSLFDDPALEISQLTFIVKQDLASLGSQISNLQSLNQSTHPNAGAKSADQEGQHNRNVVAMLSGKVADVTAEFKDVLEVRTKNIQSSRERSAVFTSTIARSQPSLNPQRSESPLYQPSNSKQRPPQSGYQNDILSLEPSSSSSLMRNGTSNQQLMMMEEAQQDSSYLQQRGQAIDTIEQTISELGGIFASLSSMVAEQGQMISRIDADTDDVVDNVGGAQVELLKYWNRVSGNRWLVAKMFGVLMIFFLLWVLISG
ncbi:MAG: hypothetical protein Q9160_007210 [Pyrenula sp. 1 TL-2023]